MSDVNTNKFGGALLFILGEFAAAEEEMLEDGGMEVFGEDDQGREGSCEVSINELAQAASDEIKHLTEQLAKANERVRELELVIVAITHADETGYVDDVGFVQGWSEVCDETKVLMNKFAIENQIKGAKFYGDKLNELGFDSVGEFTDKVCEQLRKEQE